MSKWPFVVVVSLLAFISLGYGVVAFKSGGLFGLAAGVFALVSLPVVLLFGAVLYWEPEDAPLWVVKAAVPLFWVVQKVEDRWM